MNGLLGLPPGARGFYARRAMDVQEDQQQMAQVSGLLNMRNAVSQQQELQKTNQLKGLLGQAIQSGDPTQIKALMAQIDPMGTAKGMMPQSPKWQVSERYNPQTGRAEKVMVDINNPQNVQPFGGQKASPVSIAPNGVAYDPLDTKPGATFNDPNKPFSMGPNGVVPNMPYQNFQLNKAAAGAARVNNRINTAQETEENKTIGRELGQQYADIQKAGMQAGGKLSKLDRMSQLSSGIATGKLTPALTEISALADSLGVQIDKNLGPKQAFEALSNEVALTLRSTGDGAGMPGAMSDKDREFLKAMTPSLSKTPEGNRLIIESGVKLAKRQQDVARLAREYRQQNKTLEGFSSFLQDWSNKNPLFTTKTEDVFSRADAIIGGR